MQPFLDRTATQSPSPYTNCENILVAISCAHRDALAASGASARKHGCSCICFHPLAEAVRLSTMAAVWLKCALRHETALLIVFGNYCPEANSSIYRFRHSRLKAALTGAARLWRDVPLEE